MDGLAPLCPYCNTFSKKVFGSVIYPHRPDLAHRKFFLCLPCNAYVGTHAKSGKPLGTLANAKLRRLRNQAHLAFDPVWKEGDRSAAYSTLAKKMNISFAECHIAMFNEAQCQLVVDLCNSREIYRHDTPPPEGQTGD